jgi:hypothetical protein
MITLASGAIAILVNGIASRMKTNCITVFTSNPALLQKKLVHLTGEVSDHAIRFSHTLLDALPFPLRMEKK